MGTSLLIITGSYRRLGNCEMFAKQIALDTRADSISIMRLTDFSLRPCMGCYKCLNPEYKCGLNDDLYFILERMMEYDGIIFSIPTYILSPVGQFKMLADRLACMSVFHQAFRKINAVSAVFGGIEGWRGVTQSLVNAVIRMMGFNLKGSSFIEAALPGESLDEKYMPVAEKLAKSLFTPGAAYFPSKTALCPSCRSDLFFIRDKRMICALCESSGEYRDGAWFSFNDSGRFSEKGFAEHFEGWLLPKVAEYNANKEHYRRMRDKYRDTGSWIQKDNH